MAQAIDESRAQLIASLQQQAEELAQLNRIAIALTSELDMQLLLQLITAHLQDIDGRSLMRSGFPENVCLHAQD